MPAIGLGTFGSDSVSGEAIAEAVLDAGRLGYRHFDCAAVYGNEPLIGPTLKGHSPWRPLGSDPEPMSADWIPVPDPEPADR